MIKILITRQVELNVTGNVSYYESKGYTIPKYLDERNKERVARDTKILVNVGDLPNNSGIKIEYICEGCNEKFTTRYYRYLNNKNDLCRSCNMKKIASDKKYIEMHSGDSHPRYNINKTNEEREKGRNYPEYVVWRNSVYEECNYTCQVCGDNSGGNLVAHHLNGWHWCKDERFLDWNGVTLCNECHDKFHNEYGFQNNTREQFIDFLIEENLQRNNSEASKVFGDL